MPNNRIGWGQGSVNNTIGWGSAAANNSRDWGWLHSRSYGHDETNLVGGPAAGYFALVEAAGSTISSVACVNKSFRSLQKVATSNMLKEALGYEYLADGAGSVVSSVSCVRESFDELEKIDI